MGRFFGDKRVERSPTDILKNLIAHIVAEAPGNNKLAWRLATLAEGLVTASGHAGVLIAAFDTDGVPVDYHCTTGLMVAGDDPWAEIVKIRATFLANADNPITNWLDLEGDFIKPAGRIVARALSSSDERPFSALLLLSLATTGEETLPGHPQEEAICDLCSWSIGDALDHRREQLDAGLQRLTATELSSNQLQGVVINRVAERLCTLFSAHTVTILIEQFGQLYLSATTDAELARTARKFDPRLGGTGHVFSRNEVLRLERAGPRASNQPSKPQRTRNLESIARGKSTYRLLAVPMSTADGGFGGLVAGVIRALRPSDQAPFSQAEEDALARFARHLGAVAHASLLLLSYSEIQNAQSEMICISQYELVNDGVRDAVMTYVSPGAEQLLDTPATEMRGRLAREYYGSEADYLHVRSSLRAAIQEGQKDCGPIEARIKTRDSVRTVSMSFRLLVSPFTQPPTKYTLSVIRDTSEQQRLASQHERLMALLDKEGNAYFLVDTKGRTRNPTRTDCRLTGYSESELERIDRNNLYVNPRDRDILLARVVAADGALIETRQHLLRKDGKPFFAEGVIHALKNNDGDIVFFEGLYKDVTDRMRLQSFLDVNSNAIIGERDLLRKLEENASFHLDFVNSLGHQLRAPIGALLNNILNLREQGNLSEHWKGRLTYVIGQARTCSRLTTNLAYMDQFLRGDIFDFEEISLAKIAIEIKLDFEHFAETKNIRVDVDGDGIERHVRVSGHEGLFRQVVVNLVDNALKYSFDRTRIKIRGYSDPRLGSVFEISNRGLVIDKDHRDQIFERGFRASKAVATSPNGSGIGLWLVRKIVLAHGATIRCDEVVGENSDRRTAFRIYFPATPLRQSISTGTDI